MNTLQKRTIPGGGKWSTRVRRGRLIRFTAMEAGANLSMLLYNARDLTERYNMPDTLKAQHTSRLTKDHILMSDNGRAMASIVEDSLGWHDTLSGYTRRAATDAKYGRTRYQELRNDWLRSGEENFAMELTRNSLSIRDLVPPVNLFSKVFCDEDGEMRFSTHHCSAESTVTLRSEMDLLLILSSTPNPLDPSTTYPSVSVQVEFFEADPVSVSDSCVNSCPEARRAFENTWDYYALS